LGISFHKIEYSGVFQKCKIFHNFTVDTHGFVVFDGGMVFNQMQNFITLIVINAKGLCFAMVEAR
jgi:hypothetical protein